MKLLVCILAVIISSGCMAQDVKAVPEEGSLEALLLKLSADLNQMRAQQTAEVNSLKSQMADLQRELDTARRHSAFLVQFSAVKVTAPASGPFRYDQVIFNDGTNYDPALGIYTAPFSGVYIFSLKTFTGEHETTRPAVDIVRNGQTVDRLAYDYQSPQTGHGGNSHAATVTLRLAQGDRVWVQTVSGWAADEFYGQYHTSFSGALLRSDSDV